MYKPICHIGDVLLKSLRTSVMISLFTLSSINALAEQNNQFRYSIEESLEPLTFVEVKNNSSDEIIPNAIEIFANKILSTSDKTFISFANLAMIHPDEMEKMMPVMRIITKGIGEINVEKVSVNCDFESEVLNVAYRLPNGILLSISKPLSTKDDSYVMFNLFHKRDLLLSDSANVELLSGYLKKVESRIAELA